MLETVMTPKGAVTLMGIEDFEDVAREFISDEYARAVYDVMDYAIGQVEEMQTYTNDIQSELDNALEEHNDRLWDIYHALQKIRDDGDTNKTTKAQILDAVNKVMQDIFAVL